MSRQSTNIATPLLFPTMNMNFSTLQCNHSSMTEIVRRFVVPTIKEHPGHCRFYDIGDGTAEATAGQPCCDFNTVLLFQALTSKYIHKNQQAMCLLEDLARRFIESLNLPYGLLKRDGHTCYCHGCETYLGRAGFTVYNYPVDWYFFRVNERVPPGKSLEEIYNKWDLCFHGTEVPRLESVLRLGLRIPGDTDLHGRQISELPGHINENNGPQGYDTKRIFVSPSIWYAGTDVYARPFCFKSKKSGLAYRVKVVLMVRICPGKYVASGSTIETLFSFFVNAWEYPKDRIEWSTKQRDTVVITGVLVKFERAGLLMRNGHTCNCDECKTYSGRSGFSDYNCPEGWYLLRLNVRVPPVRSLDKISNDKELCFHGTEVPRLESIFRLNLRTPGNNDLQGNEINTLHRHRQAYNAPDGFDMERIFLSPSIRLYLIELYNKILELSSNYKSNKSGWTYRVKVVLMVHIRPGSYDVSGTTSGFNIDPNYPDNTIEWATNEIESVVVMGVLANFKRYTNMYEFNSVYLLKELIG
ncbi:hypothetical protein CHS0354_036225 [Potamilus streckersoni]|uniref:Uncharacterized protein n=1 Tax=Potamilus streckersoni TaxID=2493646 RepID=A0AAE0SVP1_9BIVA|nr:hypothetical protein CHS0354_036225 [Potamilus streckersoni]